LTGSGIQAVPAQALRIGPQHTQRDGPLSAAAIQVSVCFEELRGAISGYIVTLCRRPEEAEEIMQEAFLRLYSHLASGNELRNPKAWLFRVSHNMAINHMKQRGLARTPEPPLETEEYGELSAPEPDPERRVLERERSTRLRTAIQNLTEHQRRCLYLRAEGLRYREIAETLDISVSSVVETLARAVERLRKTSNGSF